MRTFILGLVLLGAAQAALACDGPVDPHADNQTVHALANTAALLPALTTVTACSALTLPVDIFWKINRPQEDFGSHVGMPVCSAAAGMVGYSTYKVTSFVLGSH